MARQIKFVLASICILSLVILARGQNGSKSGARSGLLNALALRRTANCTGVYGLRCDTCRQMAVCTGWGDPISYKSCEAPTPYCFNDVCTAEVPSNSTCNLDFICTAGGYFPHPSDCSKYYFCPSAGGTSSQYECGVNRVYNSKTKSCMNKAKPTDCQIIDCSKTSNGFVRYTADPAYYAFCSENSGSKQTIVYKCADDVTSEFNLQLLTCEFKCPAEGRYAHPTECNKFYECSKFGTVTTPYLFSCPNSFKFDSATKICVSGSC